MSRKRRRQFKYTAFIMLPVLLAAAALAVLITTQQAGATTQTQWETLRGYINSYFSSEATGGSEANLIYGKDTLMHNLGGDTGTGADASQLASYAGEGDNMANKPVIIDNLMNNASGIVPGTEFRCNWNTAGSCFGTSSIAAVKAIVDNHAAAGFSTDIIDYCATSHTATPTTAGWGIIAQTGALSSSSIPKVYELYYSRQGWNNTYANPTAGANTVAAPETSAGGFSPTFPTQPSSCESSATDQELVRCTADWAISSTGGNSGNGVSDVTTIAGAGQTIDVRPGSIQTLSTAGTNVQAPLNTLFSAASLAQYVDPTKTFIVASASQHGGQAAMGLTMLGYQGVHYGTAGNGGYINSGVYRWSSSATPYTLFTPTVAYPLNPVAAVTIGPGVDVDTSGNPCGGACGGPTITGSPSASGITGTTATISGWSTNKPTTVRVEYGTTTSYGTVANNTVLHADHSANVTTLTGLSPDTHYYYRVTDYDANANASTTQPTGDFWTDVTPPVISSVSPANGATVYTSSPMVSASLSDASSGINTASVTVSVDSNPLAGCTVTATSVSCATSGLAYGSHTLAIGASDNAGNPASSNTTFNVGDNVPPTFANEQPTPSGTVATASPAISDDLSDAGSGINAAATVVYLDSSNISGTCTKTAGNVSCPTSGLSNASHSVSVTAYDNAGNSATDSWSFTVDTSAPVIDTPYIPANGSWVTTSTPLVQANYHTNGTNPIDAATMKIDGTSCAGVVFDNATSGNVHCTAPTLSEGGPHAVDVSVSVGTHTTTASWSFSVDTVAPNVTNVVGSFSTITADISDATSGVNAGSVAVSVDGNPLGGCTVDGAGHMSCPVGSSLSVGTHNFSGSVADNAGNTSTFGGSFDVTKQSYYWSWYDNGSPGAQNWVLMANPQGAAAATFDLYIAGNPMTPTPGFGLGGIVPGGLVAFDQYPGLVNGPVRVDSLSGPAITSQRSLWGNSLEEIPGTAANRLSDHFYWMWYDEKSPGMQNWVLVSNPDDAAASVYYEIKIGGNVMDSGSLAPGAKVTPEFPGVQQGPVEVLAWADAVEGSVPANVIASQRVLWNGSFNEVPGTPASELSNRYLWTWYDQASPGAQDWILVGNPSGTATVHVQIRIAGNLVGEGDLLPGQAAAPTYSGHIGGPVEVTSTGGNVIATQRSLWGPSFEEKPGIPASNSGGFNSLDSTYYWTWYDQASPGSANWVLVSNSDAANSVYFELMLSSIPVPVASGTIGAGSNWTGQLPGAIGGPVQVKVWTNASKTTPVTDKVIASQRVIWNGHFNEVEGTTLK